MAYRFVIEPLYTAAVATHADIAARLLEYFVQRKRHYDDVVIPALRNQGIAPPEDRMQTGAWTAVADQLLATQDDLLRLMEDAKAQGVEALQRPGRMAGPKLDVSLTPPSSANPREVMATLYVMRDGLRHAARDAAEQIGRLNPWLGRCADPSAQDFAAQLSKLAAQIRPADMAPGPYAPGPVEIEGPKQHAAMMKDYTVRVVASFRPEVEVGKVLYQLRGGREFGLLGQEPMVHDNAQFDPPLQTLTVTYSVPGADDAQARQFALALFERSREQHSLPKPETLIGNVE